MRPNAERILDYREFPILYVDDERENLRIFELTFGRDFSVVVAGSGREALELVNSQPIAVVLSDQKMPEMVGTELLKRIAAFDSKTIRILVTAYGDAATLGSAINDGGIYRYVAKPWSPEDMALTLRRGIEVYALDREREQLLRELTLLHQVSKSINQELEMGRLVDLILETITRDFGYDSAGLSFLENGKLVWKRFVPTDGSVTSILTAIELTKTTSPGLFSSLEEGKVEVFAFENAKNLDRPVREWLSEIAADELLVVPLVGQKGTIGAISVDNRRGGAGFRWQDCALLEGLANQAVTAMENARLVSDLRRSREQIMRFDRLGTLGTLAAGLAHEINNPLVSIHTFISMAPGKRTEDDPEFWQEYHALASSEVQRIRRLVETMRQLGRENGEGAARELVDLADVGGQVLTLIRREAESASVGMSFECAAGTPKIVAVRDQIHQVFMNLVLNALHASPEGETVKIRIAPESDSGFVCIEVSDSGHGIAEEDLDRIFDPFFTTKDPDKGSGLGLMICHRVVTDHSGTIEVVSRKAEGASFKVRLPIGP